MCMMYNEVYTCTCNIYSSNKGDNALFILKDFYLLPHSHSLFTHHNQSWSYFDWSGTCSIVTVLCISSLGRQDLVTQFLVKMTFLYKLVAKKLDFVLSKLQISIWKDRATVAWYKIEGCSIHYSVKAAMFFGSPEHLTFLRYEVLSPQRRYVKNMMY